MASMLIKTKTKSELMGWIESFIITALFIIISILLNDPLSIKSHFPWAWFAPVLIALHYGLWRSIFSLLLLITYALYRDPTQIYEVHFQLFILGGFLLTVICIIYNNVMVKKLNENSAIANYLQKRMQNVAYNYSVLLLAYKRLEESYITQPVTLRSSLVELRELLAKGNTNPSTLDRLLNILALHCSLDSAGIFPVKNNKLIPQPIATIGKIKSPQSNDYLIKECIDTATMTYVTTSEIFKGHLSNYLVVAPLIGQDDNIYALLLIEELPFSSLNDDNLETIHLILQYFTEGNTVKKSDLILKQYPDCPIDFANELQRLMNLQKETLQDSAAVAFQIAEGPHQLDYLFRLEREIRGIDSHWQFSQENKKILIVLMPLSKRPHVEGYKNRIIKLFMQEFNIELNNAEIKFKSAQLSAFKDSIALIEDLKKIR